MRIRLFSLFAALSLLAACDGSSSGAANTGGGGAGGDTSTTSEGGGGSASTSTETETMSTTDTGTTSTTDTGTTSTTMMADLCDTAGMEPVLFSAVQAIFSQKCGNAMACHLAPTPSEGLSLKVGESYGQLVNVPAKQACNGQLRVEAGSASGSYLVNKINDTDVCPTKKKMPPSGSLSAAEKQTIIDWICQGAKEN